MKSRGYSRLAVVLVVAALALAGGGWWLVAALTKPKPIAPEKIVKIERGDIARSVVALGKIEPLSKVQVKSKANGIIKALLVDVGDKVAADQILAELDKESLQAQVREAKAVLEGAQANLQVALAAEAKARIETANPELGFARRDHTRLEALFAQKIASQQQLDDAKKQVEITQNRQRLLEAVVESATALAAQARAQVAAATAALDRANDNLSYSTIRSPIAGIVLTRDTEVGDAVSSILNLGSAATLIMTLGDLSTVYVEGRVDEVDVGKIAVGMPVRTAIESFSGEKFAGAVTRVAPMGRELNNVTTFAVRVSISNPQGKLRVNMTANAELVLEERKQVLLAPEAALVYDRDRKASVQLLDAAAKAGWRKVAVKTGISNGQRTEILEGVAEGAPVVLP